MSCTEEAKETPNEIENINIISIEICWPAPTGCWESRYYDFNDFDGDGIFSLIGDYSIATFMAEGAHIIRFHEIGYGDEVSFSKAYNDEILEEDDDHIFCYEVTNNVVTIDYLDEDSEGRPLGMTTAWTSGTPGTEGQVKIILKHLPGIKTTECLNEGDTDFEIILPVRISP